jgi:hypothetical protein
MVAVFFGHGDKSTKKRAMDQFLKGALPDNDTGSLLNPTCLHLAPIPCPFGRRRSTVKTWNLEGKFNNHSKAFAVVFELSD